MTIVKIPHKSLQTKAPKISVVTKDVRKVIETMKEDLRTSDIGVGLAACQIGYSLPIFITSAHMPSAKNKIKEPIRVFINPKPAKQVNNQHSTFNIQHSNTSTNNTKSKIPSASLRAGHNLKSSPAKAGELEGCLSIPDVWGHVARKEEVTIMFMDENENNHTETFTGLMAVIVQHEMDHLNGILFTQRVLEQNQSLYFYNPETDKYEEMEI